MFKRIFSSVVAGWLLIFIAFSSLKASARFVSTEGYINIIVNEGKGNEFSYSFLENKTGEIYKLFFEKNAPQKPIDNLVKLDGNLSKGRIKVSKFELLDASKKTILINSTADEATGIQKVNAFIINDPNFPTPLQDDMTLENVQEIVFGNDTDSLKNYSEELSKNKMSISGSTYYLNLPNACSDSTNFEDRAKQVINYFEEHLPSALDMDRMLIFTHKACSSAQYAGLGSLGKNHFVSNNSNRYKISVSLNLSIKREVFFHEFGHNLGLKHDNYNACGAEILTSDCVASLEYGGMFNVMGSARYTDASFNSINKYDLGWLHENEVLNLDANETINSEFQLYS